MRSNEVVDLQKFRSTESAPKATDDAVSQYLPAGTTLLVGQYIIDGYLNCGGFGITYTARDSLGRKVAIKECFPSEMVYRDGKAMKTRSPKYKKELNSIVRNFVTEAHSLANVKHPNIVHVHQIFEENGTAYLAMDFIDGPDLLDMLESETSLEPREVEALTRRILDAIGYLHRIGMLHRDVSPDNVLVQRDGAPVLIDFGAARHISHDENDTAPAMKFVKDGYSPQEFYVPGSAQGTYSDLYAFAATIYHVITGQAPVDAQSRLAARAAKKPDPYAPLADRITGYSPRFLKAIDKALSLLPEERLQTTEEWLDRIGPEASAPAASLFKPVTAVLESLSIFEDAKSTSREERAPNRRPALVAGVALAALLLGGAFTLSQMRGTSPEVASALPPAERTPPTLQRIAGLASPAPLVSVWPDGFAALRSGPADDPAVEWRMPVLEVSAALAIAPLGDAPEIALSDVGQTLSGFAPPPPITGVASVPQLDVAIAADVPRLGSGPGNLDAARPPQKAPLTSIDVSRANLLGASSPEINLQSIAPVALVDRAATLPEAPRITRLELDTRAPAYAPNAPVADARAAYSIWDIALPFTSRPPRVGEGNVLVITEVDRSADLSRVGDWIEEGLILVGLNGAPLREDVPLRQQFLDAMVISDDGEAQASLFYRAPRNEVLDQAVLTVPLLRRTGLADGTVLETRKQGTTWITTVSRVGQGDTDLQVGDLIIGNATSPTRFTDHDAVEAAFTALVESDLEAAEFSVLRAGQRQSATWRFDPQDGRAASLPTEIEPQN